MTMPAMKTTTRPPAYSPALCDSAWYQSHVSSVPFQKYIGIIIIIIAWLPYASKANSKTVESGVRILFILFLFNINMILIDQLY